ncbi:MAG: Universal stress family protein, partial [uncultured Sphingomonas sp.]
GAGAQAHLPGGDRRQRRSAGRPALRRPARGQDRGHDGSAGGGRAAGLRPVGRRPGGDRGGTAAADRGHRRQQHRRDRGCGGQPAADPDPVRRPRAGGAQRDRHPAGDRGAGARRRPERVPGSAGGGVHGHGRGEIAVPGDDHPGRIERHAVGATVL